VSLAKRRPPTPRPLFLAPYPDDPPAPPVEIILPGRAPAASSASAPFAPTPGDPISDQALNVLAFTVAAAILWGVAKDIIQTLSDKEAPQ
jgi:hypothetical protein